MTVAGPSVSCPASSSHRWGLRRRSLAESLVAPDAQQEEERIMKQFLKRSVVGLVPAIMALVLGASALAGPDAGHGQGVTSPTMLALITNNDLFSMTDMTLVLDPMGTNATQHYGPYASISTDSGTCGNDWANDTFDRD